MTHKPDTDKDWYVLGEPGILRVKILKNLMPTNTFTFADYIRQRTLDALRGNDSDEEDDE